MMTGLAGVAMWLMMGLMLIGVVSGGIAWMRRRFRGRPGNQQPPPPEEATPEEILRRRYRAGEIDRDEYLRHQRDLAEH
jgi:putative membrane protein